MADATRTRGVIVTLSCPDRVGIVAAVASVLATHGVNISESQQYGDPISGRFFMRVQGQCPPGLARSVLEASLAPLVERFDMSLGVFDQDERPSVLIFVSKLGHCLNDLLYRHRIGALRAEIAGVISNHPDFASLVSSYGIDFFHLPVTNETRSEQEKMILSIVDEHVVDLVVLARYMQILSPSLVEVLSGRAINIHHSFLPSFKGARPYHQAHERGVKLIGATAHYVTSELDEGPIIEQEIARVSHAHSPDELVSLGRDIECVALARAVEWHLERRIMLNDNKTVIFR